MKGLLLGVLLGLAVQINGQYQPEQIHLSYGADPTQMTVTWVTFDSASFAMVQYGLQSFSEKMTEGIVEKFVDGGSEKRVLYMYRVSATGLKPGEKYKYRVGSPLGWSSIYTFTAMKSGNSWSPRFLLFGDMHNISAQAMARLQTEAEEGNVDFAIHVGDFSMDNDNAMRGDEFMRQIQSLAASLPFMTLVGNHENAEYRYNFSNSMPPAGGDGRNRWFSFDVGPIHFVAWDTEVLYKTGDTQQVYNQYKWLEDDLTEANKHRDLRPWIITFGHRQMYCSNNKNDNMQHCQNHDNTVRIGDPSQEPPWPNVEKIFYEHGVDLQIAGNQRDYERMWPVYNMRVCNGSAKNPYTNPTAPVHIVTGSAGRQENTDPISHIRWTWSAFQTDDYGHNRVKVVNSTHLHFDFVSDQHGKVIDSVWYIKEKHGPGLYTCHEGMDDKYELEKLTEFETILDDYHRIIGDTVDCEWDEWVLEGDCYLPPERKCGPGKQQYRRGVKTVKKGNGRDCLGNNIKTEECEKECLRSCKKVVKEVNLRSYLEYEGVLAKFRKCEIDPDQNITVSMCQGLCAKYTEARSSLYWIDHHDPITTRFISVGQPKCMCCAPIEKFKAKFLRVECKGGTTLPEGMAERQIKSCSCTLCDDGTRMPLKNSP